MHEDAATSMVVTARGARDDLARLDGLLPGDRLEGAGDDVVAVRSEAVRDADQLCALSGRAPEVTVALLMEGEDEVRLVVAVAGAVTYCSSIDRDLPGADEEIAALWQMAGIG